MRLSAKVQGVTRKSAAKARASVARASLAPPPSDLTVGSRVLVRAVEGEDPAPGVLLFIGVTQFASGTWLGVELDDAKGKNNGTVQGVKYFTARSNHGIFVRAAKVEKIKGELLEKIKEEPQLLEKIKEDSNERSDQDAQPKPVPDANLVIGSHVLVRAVENCPGIIRFAGSTEFAEGEWFGVELEKPLGKNDGTVKGVSYFSCPALHGIFARRDLLLEAPGSPSTATFSGSEPETSPTPQGHAERESSSTENHLEKDLKAELEQLRKELAKAQAAQVADPPRITRQMQEEFNNEIEQFLERREPLLPRERAGRTGFGLFLREQELGGEAFREVALRAAQRWLDMEDEARKAYGQRARLRALAAPPKKKIKALVAGAFASAVYGRKARDLLQESDSEEKVEEKPKAKPKVPKLEAADLEILGRLIHDYWSSEGLDDRTAPVFRFELDYPKDGPEKCLEGDLHLLSPETEKIGYLKAGISRFDGVTLKNGEEQLILIGFNPETLVCRVVSPQRSFTDQVDREPSRVGYVTLASLRFQKRPIDPEIISILEESDFFPPQVGDWHADRTGNRKQVERVWEDELTGRVHWSYGNDKVDLKFPSTCCTTKGKVVVPFKHLPRPLIRAMVTEETERLGEKPLARKSPEGWCDVPKLWQCLEAGRNELQVGCASAVMGELSAKMRKKRGGPRRAITAEVAQVHVRRPKVKVKCTDQAFLCKTGSRFALLGQNALGRSYIVRCGCTVKFDQDRCKYEVKVDNSTEEMEMDARSDKAIKLPQLEYAGGTPLTVLLQGGRLVDATVSRRQSWNKFSILVPHGEGEKEQLVELNEANHVEGHCAEFDTESYEAYCRAQRDRFRYLEDSITCRKMDVETQVIYIDTAVENAQVKVGEIKSLADLLLEADGERFEGQQLIYRCLMIAGPGTGKTWSSCQLMYHLSKACALQQNLSGIVKMPALVFAQKLAGMMRASGVSDASFFDLPLTAQEEILEKPWLEQAFEAEYGKQFGEVLRRALRLRSAIVLLDGIDEASDVKQVLQSYIMRRLVPLQISLVLTSRPEGVATDLATLKQSFAIMSLKPLSDEQQKQIILNQVQSEGNQFFENLLKFAEIRAKHDTIYFEEAFAEPKDRRYMEKQLPAVNRFKTEDGAWDPKMLQHTAEGVIQATEQGAAPSCEFLRAASEYFREELFGMLDQFLGEQKSVQELDAALQEKFPDTEAFKGISLAKKLYELAEKRKETKHQRLWAKVVSGTDELLSMAERFKPIFEKAVVALCDSVQAQMKKNAKDGEDISYEYDLSLGPLKDPVRITEKAADDYSKRFKEYIPEANVVDVVRARLICSSGTQMKTFLADIARGFETTIEGKAVKLQLARVKNKFSNKDLDPSRFRNVLLNLELSADGLCHFVELQVHHKLILEYNDISHAHDLYDFFRREMANQYGEEMEASLNFMLEERMLLFKEISEVPVLLSVMTMALLHSNKMPSNLFELYEMGLQNILSSQIGDVSQEKKEQIWRLMQLVSIHNQLNQKRIFMQSDVKTALDGDHRHLLTLWESFVNQGEVPFVKILADGEDAEFQFRHLSFQEALASQALAMEDTLGLEAAARFKRLGGSFAEFLNIAFFRNMLRIGAGKVGDVFGRYWPLTSILNDNGRAGLWHLLLGAKKLILVSLLRPEVSSWKAYEKAAFPPHSEDWFYTVFLFGKAQGNGSVMYSLSKMKSQVANLESALVTNEACHILFRSVGLDTSAFEVPSISFPMHWEGEGRALDVSAAPPRIGLQLSFNWKNSLLHFQESEVECLDAPRPKMQIPDRGPEMHRLCGPRWIFISQTPQEPFNFDPCACSKVMPVYLRHSSLLSGRTRAVGSQPGNPKTLGNIIAHPCSLKDELQTSTYQASYVLAGLHQQSAPVAGKRKGPERRFNDSEEGMELHYQKVDKVARASRRLQMLSGCFLYVKAAFQMWRMAHLVKEVPAEKEEVVVIPPEKGASEKVESPDPADPEDPEDPETQEEVPETQGETQVTQSTYYEDVAGNAEVFKPRDATQGLVALKVLWSRQWKAQGARVSDFQRLLLELVLPALPSSGRLRPWLRRGPRLDFRLQPWPSLPGRVLGVVKEPEALKKAQERSQRIQEQTLEKWSSSLRGECTKPWSTEFDPWKMLEPHAVRDDVTLPHQHAGVLHCEMGHPLKLTATGNNTCDRCQVQGNPQHYRCEKCDCDLCVECRGLLMQAYWQLHVKHTWPAEKRHKAMRAVLWVREAKTTRVQDEAECLGGPPHVVYKKAMDLEKCDGCHATRKKGYRSSDRSCEGQLCRKCFMQRRKWIWKRRRPWDRELAAGAVWDLLPADVVLLDHPTRRQVAIARRRQVKGKTWQQLFGLRRFPALLNLDFFTHRMEPEKAASFVTNYVERFRTKVGKVQEDAWQRDKKHNEDVTRCLVAKQRRWRKRLEAHPKTSLRGLLPRPFFTHRLEGEAAAFLEKFSKILEPAESDATCPERAEAHEAA